MKLVTFQAGNKDRVGAVKGDWVVDIGAAIRLLAQRKAPRKLARQSSFRDAAGAVMSAGPAPAEMIPLLQRGESWRKALDEVLEALVGSGEPARSPKGLLRPLEATRLRAPIPCPSKVTGVGLNYASHAHEQGKEPPGRPVFFMKSVNVICGPGDPIVLPPNSAQVDYEAEFAVVIGKGGRRISEEDAYEHIAGYMILNDVSARDMQYSDRQWFRGKSCDTFGPTGPWIVTRDELADPHRLRIFLTLNGKTMQDSNTGDMIFKIPYLVSYLSQSLTWEVGDILSTGTPGGVGHYRQPQVFLKPGDTVSITVEGLGTLVNPVAGPVAGPR